MLSVTPAAGAAELPLGPRSLDERRSVTQVAPGVRWTRIVRDGGSAIGFGLGAQLDRLVEAGRLDVAFRLKENRWNGTIAPQLVVRRVFAAPTAYDDLRAWLADEWRAGEQAWTPDARRIFAELGLTSGGARRQLLESESFRALLERGTAELPIAA